MALVGLRGRGPAAETGPAHGVRERLERMGRKILQSTYYWGVPEKARSNRERVRALTHRTNIASPPDHFYFVAGSMFWLRPRAVSELLELNLAGDEFEAETGQRDRTFAHALARFPGLLALTKGFWLADTAGGRFDRVVDTGRPLNAASLGRSFAHPTFDGEPID
jgi:hypothetical protein